MPCTSFCLPTDPAAGVAAHIHAVTHTPHFHYEEKKQAWRSWHSFDAQSGSVIPATSGKREVPALTWGGCSTGEQLSRRSYNHIQNTSWQKSSLTEPSQLFLSYSTPHSTARSAASPACKCHLLLSVLPTVLYWQCFCSSRPARMLLWTAAPDIFIWLLPFKVWYSGITTFYKLLIVFREKGNWTACTCQFIVWETAWPLHLTTASHTVELCLISLLPTRGCSSQPTSYTGSTGHQQGQDCPGSPSWYGSPQCPHPTFWREKTCTENSLNFWPSVQTPNQNREQP